MTGFSADALALHGARYGSSPTTSSGQSPVGYAVKKATGRGGLRLLPYDDFGAGFIVICSYLPYPPSV